ncbi:diacylglycerol kinase [Gordonibacter sp. An230]|uniref:diacylglycerol kinase family protein n=1 Tax=Gordonibacter sp. An230 TaxID=1965592 RepID=UPI000B3A3775|nr:diacylglycerol kinase family protein [Gordonibacter sp. An230]OUO91507.1 diacylglycerol kinase [Gordonibacter sp. An230]
MDEEERRRAARTASGFVRNDEDKASGSRARFPLTRAFGCAWSGVVYAARSQRNMKIHLVVAAAAVVLGCALRIDGPSWAAVLVCVGSVIAAELANTAVESVVDLVSPEYHELARRAKDCAAGAVLVLSLAAVAVACAVYLPPILAILTS